MRILLTGGSGTVGQNALHQLTQNEQYDIVAFDVKNKRSQSIYKPYKDKIELHYGDISNYDHIAAACHNIDFVIHLAAIIPPLADLNPSLAHSVNVKGTANLIKALEEHSPQAFLTYASSVSVYGDRLVDPNIKVGDLLIPSIGDEYAKTKIEAEQLIQQSQLDWSIFRLSAIMGTGNHKVSGLMFHMPLDTPMEITTPADTARAFVHAVEKTEQLSHRIFNLGGGEDCRISYKEFLAKNFLASGLGKLDFPEKAFAEKNFHCGYYADGDDLNDILDFRRDTIETYFEQLEDSISPIKKLAAGIFKRPIKKYLLSQSEPFEAYHKKDQEQMERYFN